MLSSDLESKAELDLAELMGGPDLSSQAGIRGDYGRLRKVCSFASGCDSSSVAEWLSLVILGVEVMRRASIQEGLWPP